MKAEKCPVCDGSGKVAIRDGKLDTSAAAERDRTCHGCGGKGWVEVPVRKGE